MELRALGIATLVGGLLCTTASSARAQDADVSDRLILGGEAAVMFPFTDPQIEEHYPGGTVSLAMQWPVTKFLMPLLRLRSGWLSPRQGSSAQLLSASIGLRFRPRGIAFPEEPSRASCIWAEVDASIASLNGALRPAYEVAIGFGFLVDDVTLGPVVRFIHVVEDSSSSELPTYVLTGGLEVLLNDAR
ncbi:MAG: hypothetical protein KC619_34855 [Myxococcales bacterium]|nr:hypothetical protein [Myxococcales bacterium]